MIFWFYNSPYILITQKGATAINAKKRKDYFLYRIIKSLVRLFSPKMELTGAEHLPEGPAIIVANHCQMYGPIACELYYPGYRYAWCAGQMMKWKEVPSYAFQDFWSQKPKWTHPFYKLLAYLITPVSVCVFNNADTIAVYHDSRIISTFKKTVSALCDGAQVVIFPEHDVKHNHIIYDFQDKFIDIARLYCKKSGQPLPFVPMYIGPNLGKMCLGEPVLFDPNAPIDEERSRIRACLMERITALGCELPEHTVVPYRNIPKKDYPSNIAPKEAPYEKASR